MGVRVQWESAHRSAGPTLQSGLNVDSCERRVPRGLFGLRGGGWWYGVGAAQTRRRIAWVIDCLSSK